MIYETTKSSIWLQKLCFLRQIPSILQNLSILPHRSIMEQPIIVSIEANIGAGKSTVLQKLQEVLDPKYTTCIQEPIQYWENFRDPASNRSLLELYYGNPEKYAFSLQTMIYSSLSRILEETIENTRTSLYRPLLITERSLQSSSGIFAKMLYNSGTLSPIEYQVYQNCVANQPTPLDVCIYLRTEPEVCYERVRHRNRQGEQRISLDYLRTCHDAHEQWISGLPSNLASEALLLPPNTPDTSASNNASVSFNTHLRIIDVGTKTPEKILAEVLEILADLTHI